MKRSSKRPSKRSKSVKGAKRVSANALGAAHASWAEQLRGAAAEDGRSIYALAVAAFGTRDKQAQLGRFLSGRGGITLAGAEQLGRALGFRLVRDRA